MCCRIPRPGREPVRPAPAMNAVPHGGGPTMHRHRILSIVLVAAVLAAFSMLTAGIVASAPALPAAETFAIDPVHSNVGFRITHFFSKVPGHFTKFEGSIVLD